MRARSRVRRTASSSSRRSSVTSRLTATYPVMDPWSSTMGEIEARSSKIEPSLRRLTRSADHGRPERSLRHMAR